MLAAMTDPSRRPLPIPALALLSAGVACAAAATAIAWSWMMRSFIEHPASAGGHFTLILPRPSLLAFSLCGAFVLFPVLTALSRTPRSARAACTKRLGLALLSFGAVLLPTIFLPRDAAPAEARAALLWWRAIMPFSYMAAAWLCVWTLLGLARTATTNPLSVPKRRLGLVFFLLVHVAALLFARPSHSLAKDFDFNIYNNLMEQHKARYICPSNFHQDRGNAFYANRARRWGAGPPHTTPEYWEGRRYGLERLGMPALLAPAYGIGLNIEKRNRYAVVLMLSVVLAFTMVNIFRLALHLTKSPRAALLAAAAGGLSGPLMFFGISAYPESVTAAALIFCTRKIIELGHSRSRIPPLSPRERAGVRVPSVMAHVTFGLALAYLPWIHEKMLAFAAVLFVIYLLTARPPWKRLWPVLLLIACSLLLQMRYYWLLYGRVYPRYVHTEGFQPQMLIRQGLWGLFFDRSRGILPVAPWFLFGAIGLATWVRRFRSSGLWVVGMTLCFLVATSAFQGWYGGSCAQPRYITSLMPFFAVGLALAWTSIRSRAMKALILALSALGILQGYLGVLSPRVLETHRTALFKGLFPHVFKMDGVEMLAMSAWTIGLVSLVILSERRRRTVAWLVPAACAGLVVFGSYARYVKETPTSLIVGNQPRLASLLQNDSERGTFNRRILVMRRMKRFSRDFDADLPIAFVDDRKGKDQEYVRWTGSAGGFEEISSGPKKTLFDGAYTARYRLRRCPGTNAGNGGTVALQVYPVGTETVLGRDTIPFDSLPLDWMEHDVPFSLAVPTRIVNCAVLVNGSGCLDVDSVRITYHGRR